MSGSQCCTRRQMLGRLGCGFGGVALASLLHDEGLLANSPHGRPRSHHRPHARSVIWLFMEGGPSGFDLFDPKPELDKSHGKRLKGVDPFFGKPGPIMRCPFTFAQYGQSGAWVCDQLPHLATCVDDIVFIKSMHCDSNSHAPAMYQMNTGYVRPGFPSAGAWVNYGLGSANRNLPGFVVMNKISGTKGGPLNWGAGFLPASHQGTVFRAGPQPILNLKRPEDLSAEHQRAQLDLAAQFNATHLAAHPGESELEARIESFELAYRMQAEAFEAVDLSRESDATRSLYGLDEKISRDFGTKCLLARRLVERGVRFIQLYPNEQWDAHSKFTENHTQLCRMTDRPVAGLLHDLKQRGLLDETLVVWGGEFGRLPVTQGKDGRDHNPYGFLMWMAGGGVRGGTGYGELDDLGYKIASHPVSLPDFHATILHLLGFDHEALTYKHNGRKFRLTDVAGQVIHPLLK